MRTMITKEDVSKYREISRAVREDKINPFILDAQKLDLEPLLGERFFADLYEADLDQNQDYKDLFDGCSYEYQGHTYRHVGLGFVLAIYARARYMLFGSYTDTPFGFQEKTTQDSKPVSDSHKRNIYTMEQNTAYNHWLSVERYLDRNAHKYPLWSRNESCGSARRTGSVRIYKIQ